MNYKLTIDINLIDENAKVPGMNTLKRWKSEGKIELVEAIRPSAPKPTDYHWPGATPTPTPSRKRRGPMKKEPTTGVNFRSVATVLYPAKDSQKLDLIEMNNVAHLIKHHERKGQFFVTFNVKDFIADGKQQRLKNQYGIVAVTPEEAVATLTSIEGWK